jgi:hypothetical protein
VTRPSWRRGVLTSRRSKTSRLRQAEKGLTQALRQRHSGPRWCPTRPAPRSPPRRRRPPSPTGPSWWHRTARTPPLPQLNHPSLPPRPRRRRRPPRRRRHHRRPRRPSGATPARVRASPPRRRCGNPAWEQTGPEVSCGPPPTGADTCPDARRFACAGPGAWRTYRPSLGRVATRDDGAPAPATGAPLSRLQRPRPHRVRAVPRLPTMAPRAPRGSSPSPAPCRCSCTVANGKPRRRKRAVKAGASLRIRNTEQLCADAATGASVDGDDAPEGVDRRRWASG